ncbi:trans-sulfuration enzyme family protein [Enterococcus xiangfangensis]|uniref:cysteine-S-conjugate beta-lyase n=1 Tax=Enterococcus xiangfangensis TaxID=1296537 RepID=A0ABU3F8V2_9ENTE|nr:PLP-dependent aspartate aminotransferase family protein [Enterococcus xiangfangensis]MBM7711201.1 cystathionine beta-lyase [Enterococcus xiangfangensis]MDT2759102.1 PLP-dependent aspartate aminotransferase family protein [Enterococcus xiangfangensis]NBK09263.1 PLP-dependent transferase [Enterococcus asini]
MKDKTKLIHGYHAFDEETGASSIPIYQCSTFKQASIKDSQPYTYSRFSNPTRTALEEAVAALENGKYATAFASGMSAISAVLLSFNQGDHIVMCKSIYGGTFQLVNEVMKRFGIEVTFVDETDLTAWEQAIQPNTRGLYLETPSNPLLSVTNIAGVVAIAKAHHLVTMIDNTFMTPQFQKPLALGIDVVIHSATKFINGHSDVVAGLVITNDEKWEQQIKLQQKVLGGILGIEDCWLTMRGLKTMALRMEQSARSAEKISQMLEKHPAVRSIHYPGLPSHPGYQVHQQQATSGGAVLSFELANQSAVYSFAEALKIPIAAVSLGGVESILSYPVTMSHACVPKAEREKQGVTDGLLRLSVGIEDTEDLLADLEQALTKIQ